jgi:hypothetical protein
MLLRPGARACKKSALPFLGAEWGKNGLKTGCQAPHLTDRPQNGLLGTIEIQN